MTLTIPPEIERVAKEMSLGAGVNTDTLLLQALEAHFLPVPHELQSEFDAWNLATDQDMEAFDSELETSVVVSR